MTTRFGAANAAQKQLEREEAIKQRLKEQNDILVNAYERSKSLISQYSGIQESLSLAVEEDEIFFAAFEPSGDVLAARLIDELKRRDPSLRFTGFGGPNMQAAGAELIEVTTEHATIASVQDAARPIRTALRSLIIGRPQKMRCR